MPTEKEPLLNNHQGLTLTLPNPPPYSPTTNQVTQIPPPSKADEIKPPATELGVRPRRYLTMEEKISHPVTLGATIVTFSSTFLMCCMQILLIILPRDVADDRITASSQKGTHVANQEDAANQKDVANMVFISTFWK
ncbi:hypothetical protein BDN72DRAFT_847521 [Pluteus cervinus]|uniref:Uncharacterized protein n=1 Tax=Pluteus cervinus TaxID=181527 RepID=A0ACD3ACY7_9AGAR|nr:hypothetical protein BDN72DRAFT_847521 [Pluteus cervinus]